MGMSSNAAGPKALVCAAALAAFTGSAQAAIVNLATGGTATATSEAHGTTASRAIDGQGIGGAAHPNIWHSGNELNPALTVDLGNLYALGDDAGANPDIVLSNRTDCCGFRMTDMRIEVWGNQGTAGPADLTVNFDPAGATTFGVELAPIEGRYVRLTKLNTTDPGGDDRSINLAEMQIFGDSVPVPEPAALGLLGVGALALARRRRRRS